MMRRFLLAFAATALVLSAARADDVLVQRVYSVADLVVPVPDPISPHAAPATSSAVVLPCPTAACPDACRVAPPMMATEKKPGMAPGSCPEVCRVAPAPTAPKTMHRELVQLIVNTVAPDTWTTAGGEGTIEFHAIGLALVVRQKPAVHQQIVDLLASLRRLQDQQITFDVRLISVSDRCYEAMGRPGSADGVSMMTIDETRAILEMAQGDVRTNVMQAPRLTAMDGQEATVKVGDMKAFVVGVDRHEVEGQTVMVPRQEMLSSGVTMTLRGNILPGRKAISVRMNAEVTELQGEGALFPITTSITPVFEGGAKGQPIPFTQFIQQPTQTTCGITKMIAVPTGRTAVFCAGRRSHEVAEVSKIPVLGDLPLLGEFFSARSRHTETDNLVVLLTPRVISLAGGEEAEAVPVKPASQVQLEMTVFSVCDCFWAHASGSWAKMATENIAFLGDEAKAFTDALHGCDGRKLYAEPRMITLSGRPATFETRGNSLTLTPTLSCDGSCVRLEGTIWGLDAATGTPVLPTISVPSGKAAIYRLGRCPATGETMYAMVSPTSGGPFDPVRTAVAPTPAACDPRLVELMTAYRAACAEGRADDARTLAQRCLKIDPTCFGR
ncbi:MAG: hypothetical protein U0746_04795 [Gemmataceae bacterium]